MNSWLADWAIIALGSNQGDSTQLLCKAVEELKALSSLPILKSSIWECAPIDSPPGSPNFFNAVAALQPRADETPDSLIRKLLELESKLGRQRTKRRNAPRLLDLDLIAFGSERRATKQLSLPHPRATQRRFVLEPLVELAPEYILPGDTRTVLELLEAIRAVQAARIVGVLP